MVSFNFKNNVVKNDSKVARISILLELFSVELSKNALSTNGQCSNHFLKLTVIQCLLSITQRRGLESYRKQTKCDCQLIKYVFTEVTRYNVPELLIHTTEIIQHYGTMRVLIIIKIDRQSTE